MPEARMRTRRAEPLTPWTRSIRLAVVWFIVAVQCDQNARSRPIMMLDRQWLAHAKIDLLTAASAVAGETARNLEKTRRRRHDFTIFFRLASSAASSCPQCT